MRTRKWDTPAEGYFFGTGMSPTREPGKIPAGMEGVTDRLPHYPFSLRRGDMEKSVLISKEEGILTITLNKPKSLNALDFELREDLFDVLYNAARDDEVRVLVITGNGKAFCAGGDLKTMGKDFAPGEGRVRMQNIQRITKVITGMDKLVIAAVNGPAAGAGCNLALSCDFIIAAEEAKFVEPFGKVGLIPDMGGLYFLPRLVGLLKAKELVFTWQSIDAREAEKIGMVTRVVPLENLYSEVKKLADQLVRGPALANGLTKSIINKSLQSTLDQVLELEANAQDMCLMSSDHKEGVRAFIEKRKPEFNRNLILKPVKDESK